MENSCIAAKDFEIYLYVTDKLGRPGFILGAKGNKRGETTLPPHPPQKKKKKRKNLGERSRLGGGLGRGICLFFSPCFAFFPTAKLGPRLLTEGTSGANIYMK